MNDIGTTHEDLEQFLAGHHLTGAGLRREGMAEPRTGATGAHWRWDGIYRASCAPARSSPWGPAA